MSATDVRGMVPARRDSIRSSRYHDARALLADIEIGVSRCTNYLNALVHERLWASNNAFNDSMSVSLTALSRPTSSSRPVFSSHGRFSRSASR